MLPTIAVGIMGGIDFSASFFSTVTAYDMHINLLIIFYHRRLFIQNMTSLYGWLEEI